MLDIVEIKYLYNNQDDDSYSTTERKYNKIMLLQFCSELYRSTTLI